MKLQLKKSTSLKAHIRFRFEGDSPRIDDFTGEPNETAIRYDSGVCVVHVGLGKKTDYADYRLRSAAATAVRTLAGLKRTSAALFPPANLKGHAAAVEGAVLGTYVFDRYLSKKPQRVTVLDVVSESLTARDLREIQAVCDGVFAARDLVNDNAGVVTPAYLAAQARAIGKRGGMTVQILDEKQIHAKGMGLLEAVGQGSPNPPRLVLMHYRGNPGSKEVSAVVGKGITFDSGGLNLKPSGHIETMRIDMAGAATVLGLMQTLGQLRPKVNVTGVCACAHNAIQGNAYCPGDIIRAYDGTTVEICNTDAEGRLALADAIAYVRDTVKPSRIVDLATLTGGILITFADVLCGLFASDDALAAELMAAGEATHERMWRLPVYQEFRDAMKGDRSDLRNLATFKRGYASSITGAAFIRAFSGDTPWAHLDIAGTAFNENDPRGETPRHATGFGVRLLVQFLKSIEGRGRST
jgi:leucyl aminopeptidase